MTSLDTSAAPERGAVCSTTGAQVVSRDPSAFNRDKTDRDTPFTDSMLIPAT